LDLRYSHSVFNLVVTVQPTELSLIMDNTSQQGSDIDLEKKGAFETKVEPTLNQHGEVGPIPWWKRVGSYGVELRGVEPVAVEDRTDKRPINILSFWWTSALTLLA
jgi:hypothetical protein